MSTIGLILVLSSCVTHATWNALSKRASAVPGLFFWVSVFCTVLGLPMLVLFWPRPNVPAVVWLCLAVSGVSLTIYYVGLQRAYQSGEMSFVYPLARCSPVLALLLIEMAGGVSHQWRGIVGVGLIVVGSGALPFGGRRGARASPLRQFGTPAAFWALITAAGTVGYAVSDKTAMDALKPFGPSATAWYLISEFAAAAILLSIVGRPLSGAGGWHVPRRHWLVILTVALLTQGTYFLVLLAMRDNNISYVVACRQFSIVIGAGLGLIWLREREAVAGRIIGSLTITAGLVLTALA